MSLQVTPMAGQMRPTNGPQRAAPSGNSSNARQRVDADGVVPSNRVQRLKVQALVRDDQAPQLLDKRGVSRRRRVVLDCLREVDQAARVKDGLNGTLLRKQLQSRVTLNTLLPAGLRQ